MFGARTVSMMGDWFNLLALLRGLAKHLLGWRIYHHSKAVLGFVPMVFHTGIGAEIQRPLALVVVGGMITATGDPDRAASAVPEL